MWLPVGIVWAYCPLMIIHRWCLSFNMSCFLSKLHQTTAPTFFHRGVFVLQDSVMAHFDTLPCKQNCEGLYTTCVTRQESVSGFCDVFILNEVSLTGLRSVKLNWLEVCGQERLEMLVGVVSEAFSILDVCCWRSFCLDLFFLGNMMAAVGGRCWCTLKCAFLGGQ